MTATNVARRVGGALALFAFPLVLFWDQTILRILSPRCDYSFRRSIHLIWTAWKSTYWRIDL